MIEHWVSLASTTGSNATREPFRAPPQVPMPFCMDQHREAKKHAKSAIHGLAQDQANSCKQYCRTDQPFKHGQVNQFQEQIAKPRTKQNDRDGDQVES